jgi:hypothetical protein
MSATIHNGALAEYVQHLLVVYFPIAQCAISSWSYMAGVLRLCTHFAWICNDAFLLVIIYHCKVKGLLITQTTHLGAKLIYFSIERNVQNQVHD